MFAEGPVAEAIAAPPHVLHGMSILAADDHATNRKLLHALLTSWGMKPTIVDGGQAALATLERARADGQRFPIVLLDGHMPDVDGFMVAERIRTDPSLASVTVLLLTSDLQQGQIARARDLGVSRYLVKPVTPSELLDAVLLALGQTRPLAADEASASPTSRPARRLSVLVAEDNRVNQQVIVRLLDKLGHRAMLAGSGSEALALLETQPFDLVLMDVQMPEMDGLTATAAIRAREAGRPGGGHLPVVALTAHAMKGDRERCLVAGMDEYLSKPVTLAALATVLDRLFAEIDAPASPTDGAAPGAGSEPLDLTLALDYVGGDRELLGELMDIFVADSPQHRAALRIAMNPFDAAAVARAAHGLKGSMRALGACAGAALAERLEMAGVSGDARSAEMVWPALETEMDRVLRFVADRPLTPQSCEA
jgi:CheY-like chemotaxis protein